MTELEQRVEERTHELTEVKKRLEQSLAELKAVQEQLIHTAKFHAMGEAATAIAHELPDPLSIIVSLAHSLAKEVASEGKMQAQLKQICEAAFCCQRLVQSLLTFVEAKACINAMVCHINLGNILLEWRSGKTRRQTMADPP
jgi:phosphoglycerate-specific signal transduction histidine kinase